MTRVAATIYAGRERLSCKLMPASVRQLIRGGYSSPILDFADSVHIG
jgi:hypothetical protein